MSAADVLAFVRLKHELAFSHLILPDWDAADLLHFRYFVRPWKTAGDLPEEERYSVSLDCSDTFFWGSADVEAITVGNVSILKAVLIDVAALYESDSQDSDQRDYQWAAVVRDLFAARVRKTRPQGAAYRVRYPEEAWPLFDACGPERELGLGNPRAVGA